MSDKIYRNRKKIGVGLLLLCVFGVFLFIYMFIGETGDPYVNEEAYVYQDTTGLTEIQMDDFVGDEGEVEERSAGSYFYHEDEFMKEFYFIGVFDGNTFTFSEDDGGNEVFRISSELQPGDGVINAYIVAKAVEVDDMKKIEANIYIDEDFRSESSDDLNIAWGVDWENFREFEFDEVAPGIYKDSIMADHVHRFVHGSDISDANIAVGTFDQEEIEEQDMDDVHAAVIMK